MWFSRYTGPQFARHQSLAAHLCPKRGTISSESMLIDSHCHLDDYEDLPGVLARAKGAGVGKLLAIGIGEGPESMHRALEIAHEFPEVFASAGIHPQEA